MLIFRKKFQYLVNGLRFGFYYGLRFRSNRFNHSVKRFGRFGLDTLILPISCAGSDTFFFISSSRIIIYFFFILLLQKSLTHLENFILSLSIIFKFSRLFQLWHMVHQCIRSRGISIHAWIRSFL